MSIVVRFSPTALTAKKYDETIRQLKNAGEWPPAGLDYHVCFGSDGNLKVSEIWNSREQFEAFAKRLMPILAGAGIQFANPPDIFEVHNIIKGRPSGPAARSRIANRSAATASPSATSGRRRTTIAAQTGTVPTVNAVSRPPKWGPDRSCAVAQEGLKRPPWPRARSSGMRLDSQSGRLP